MGRRGPRPRLYEAAREHLLERWAELDGRNLPTTTRRIAAAIYDPRPPQVEIVRRVLAEHPETFRRVTYRDRRHVNRHAYWRLTDEAIEAERARIATLRDGRHAPDASHHAGSGPMTSR